MLSENLWSQMPGDPTDSKTTKNSESIFGSVMLQSKSSKTQRTYTRLSRLTIKKPNKNMLQSTQ